MVMLFQKKKEGKVYWYLGENKWVDGKCVRAWQKYIGTSEKLKNLLEEGIKPKKIDIVDYGLIASLLQVEKELNFVNIVDKIIPKRKQGLSIGEHLLISIINRLDEPTSKNKFGDWFNETILKKYFKVKTPYLSSQNYWNHWNHFSDNEINLIQEKILEKIISKNDISDLYYDPTNFATYIEDHKKNELPKFGYAKGHIKGLRQINLALLLTKEDSIPLWHQTYEGNKNDVKEFHEFMQILFKRIKYFSKKCKVITLILDKGNNSKKNFKLLNEKIGFFVLGSLKPSEYPEIMQTPIEEFTKTYVDDKENETKYYSSKENIYEGIKRIVITYNEDLAYCQKKSTLKAVNKALEELRSLHKKLNKENWAIRDKVFLKLNQITGKSYLNNLMWYKLEGKDKELHLDYGINEENYKIKENTFGKNMLFTDNLQLSPEEIIKTYRNKDIIEKQFQALKNPYIIRLTPMWCWTDKMIKMHTFTCVMALLFLSILTKKVRKAGLNLSQQKLIEQLKKIKQVVSLINEDKIIIRKTSMNETQRKLYSLLKIKDY